MTEPDVRIRLSAEGVAEVVAAFRKVQAGAGSAARQAKMDFSGLGGVLDKMKGTVTALAGAFAGIEILRVAKEGAEAGEQFAILQKRLGGTIEDLSALDVMLRRMGQTLEGATPKITRFFVKTEEAARGVGAAVANFRAAGMSDEAIRGFANESAAQRIETFGKALAKLPTEMDRLNAAIRVLGPRAGSLVPLFLEIGEKGMAGAREEARRLGALLSSDLVAAAQKAKHGFEDISIAVQAMKIRFAAGFASGLLAGVGAIGGAADQSAAAIERMGRQAGNTFGWIIAQSSILVDSISTMFETLEKSTAINDAAWKEFMKGNFEAAKALWAERSKLWEKAETDQRARAQAVYDAWKKAKEEGDRAALVGTTKGPGAEPPGDPDAEARQRELEQEQKTAIQKAGIDARLEATKAGLKAEEKEAEAAFARGEIDATAYWDQRKKLAVDAINAEIDALKEKKALLATEADAGKRLSEEKKIAGEIAKLRTESDAASAEADEEKRKALKDLGEGRVAIEAKIAELQGRFHDAAMKNIDEEVRKAEELLAKLGGSKDANRKTIEALREGLEAQEEFVDAQAKATGEMDDFARERARIEADAVAGLMSQTEAEERIVRLQKERVAGLRAIGEEALRAAEITGDPERVETARRFLDDVNAIEVAVVRQEAVLTRLKATAQDALRDGVYQFLSEGVYAAESFGQAMRAVLLGVVDAMQRLLAQIIATRIALAVFGGISGGIGGGSASTGFNPETVAEGGLITGPGTGTSDSIPARLSDGEYVVRARSVAQPGVLPLLEAINRGGSRAMGIAGGVQRFAGGGLVSGGGSAKVDGTLTVGLDEGLVLKHLESPVGQRIILRAVAKNRRHLRRVMGG